MYDNGDISCLTKGTTAEYEPQIYEEFVVWRAHDGNDFEIYLYDGEKTLQITDNAKFDANPLVTASGRVVWMMFDGNDYEVYMYEENETKQLTNNLVNDIGVHIAGNSVVWKIKEPNGQESLGFVKTK